MKLTVVFARVFAVAVIMLISVAPIPVAATPEQQASSLLNGLVAYWSFNDTTGDAADLTGRGNHLTAYDGPGSFYGKLGLGRTLDGVTQYFGRPSSGNDDLTLGGTDFTITTWLRPNSTYPLVYLGKYNGTIGEITIYSSSNGQYTYDLHGSTGRVGRILGGSIFTGEWQLVVARYKASTRQFDLTVNNVLVGSAVTDGPVGQTTAAFTIGRRENGIHFANGLVDDTGVWKRWLTNDELSQLWNSGAGLAYPFDGSTAPPDQGAYGGAGAGTSQNFWNLLIGGLTGLVMWFVNGYLPSHQSMDMALTVMQMANTAIVVVGVYILQLINPTWAIALFVVVGGLEAIRWIYAAWQWLKGILPLPK